MTDPFYADGRVTVLHGDCRKVLAELPDSSIDSIVTDPPYDLTSGKKGGTGDASVNPNSPAGRSMISTGNGGGFMGKDWDATGVAFDSAMWAECLRVLKPGGHLLAFGGTRTSHRMVCAIEDAGFEVRDSIIWNYSTGFPKSMNLSRAIDRELGVKGTFGEPKSDAHAGWIARGRMRGDDGHEGYQRPWMDDPDSVDQAARKYEPGSDQAREFQGFGTALKPAHEPICLARKPLVGTVAKNVLEHGTGALNIDGCRVGTTDVVSGGGTPPYAFDGANSRPFHEGHERTPTTGNPAGRWPSNVLFVHAAGCQRVGTRTIGTAMHYPASRGKGGIGQDGHAGQEGLVEISARTEDVADWVCEPGCPVAVLDEQSGDRPGCKSPSSAVGPESILRQDQGGYQKQGPIYPDDGGASRYFPTFEVEVDAPFMYVAKAPASERVKGEDGTLHPTVKPLALIRHLVKLVTPPGGVVLDPFLGSGTTAEAAILEGFNVIGVEMTAEYLPLIVARVERGYRGGPQYAAVKPRPQTEGQDTLF